MTEELLQPLFLEGSEGRIFVMLRGTGEATRCVLFVPPFAEELNRCRRQMTETARLFSQQGYRVILPDLFGTGDSEGDFEDARWEYWIQDLSCVADWAESESLEIDAVVATRLGCCLAARASVEAGLKARRSVFWQPVYSGDRYLRQFLRLRVAAGLGNADSETVDTLQRRLESGETVDVAGYRLAPELYEALRSLNLESMPCEQLGDLRVYEVKRRKMLGDTLSGLGAQNWAEPAAKQWNARRTIAGEPFWGSTEVVTNPELTRLSVEFVVGARDELA